MSDAPFDVDPVKLFGDYMKVTGVPGLTPGTGETGADARLAGKKLGVVNGATWISLWSTYFGKTMLPGAQIIQVGNEAVQLNFLRAHGEGKPCPPEINIDLFCRYARDLFELYEVDAVLISCSTMNRAFRRVSEAMAPLGVPVLQIDEAMMEQAVASEGRILVIATHGPTVASTQALLRETADRMGKKVDFLGATLENAFDLLGRGRIAEHNAAIAGTIRRAQAEDEVHLVVLAQLSMSVFSFSFPDPLREFGVPVLNSGQTGFARAGEVLRSLGPRR
jgi:hypothetical protein